MPRRLHVVKRPRPPAPDVPTLPTRPSVSNAWGVAAIAGVVVDELRTLKPEARDVLAVRLHAIVREKSEQLWRDARIVAALEQVLQGLLARWGDD
jgi:hypothetical protein